MANVSKRVLVVALAGLFGQMVQAEQHNTLTKQELADGWMLLFDGDTDFGWKAGTNVDWKVTDGVISATSGEVGLLYTTTQFADYVLKVDFRSAKGTNSGVFLRTLPDPGDVATDCYELNIADQGTNPFPTGAFVKRKKASPLTDTQRWQTFEATVQGGHFVVKLDGRQVLEYTDAQPVKRGHIGLQFNTGKIEFRNVKLKPLGLSSVFNGKDLTGWKVHPSGKSVFAVTPEGWLNVKNGGGQIETEGRWADFVLQLDVLVNGNRLNSGIFFRSIPGEWWQGYESQIHNGYKDNDPTKPMDYGTGGIYRRQPARRIVAKDFDWFHKTVIADGPHMAVWVNGIQVSDWTDPRKPDLNPRKGLCTEAGTIIFQGHDPTTDLSFRNIRIVELPKR